MSKLDDRIDLVLAEAVAPDCPRDPYDTHLAMLLREYATEEPKSKAWKKVHDELEEYGEILYDCGHDAATARIYSFMGMTDAEREHPKVAEPILLTLDDGTTIDLGKYVRELVNGTRTPEA